MLNCFQEDNGNLSATRIVFVLFGMVVLSIWAILSLCASALMAIPDSIVTILLGLATSKVVQKPFENK
jgi:cytochrome c biogenesis protein CcdA